MRKINKICVSAGIYWVEVPGADIRVLCGCPADSVKHLIHTGLIVSTEEQGVTFETGPNAILLSDTMLQKGSFANMAEFPVLQMLYSQGMLLPGHPNNTGVKPLLMGAQEQIQAQMEYIYRGNYGLTSVDELIDAGVSAETADEMFRMKLKFAFGKIHATEDFLDTCVIEKERVEVRHGLSIKRIGFNVFEFDYQDEKVTINLNLQANEKYKSTYSLGFHNIKRKYFSVIHSGEGDGWDVHRPSMSSILMFQGKIYLIDAGPNLLETLTALGIGINEVEGVFHTHSHDDHFAGLPTLIRTDKRLKYYATKLVRASVTKKLCALMSMDESRFSDYFDVQDLEFDRWNVVNGLEVKPIFSPHPVETNLFIFRTFWGDGYHSYAHFSDISSFKVLQSMLTTDDAEDGVSQAFYDKVRDDYLSPVDLKKIDIGGGLIHGNADDFKADTSKNIVLAHTSKALTDAQKEIGSDVPFGMVDALIPTYQDYGMRRAYDYLSDDFPSAPEHQLRILLNNETLCFDPGTIMIKEGVVNDKLYLVLSGSVEMIDSRHGSKVKLYTGSLLGELSALQRCPASHTYRTESYVQALCISSQLYADFVRFNNLYDEIERLGESWQFLENIDLFDEAISHLTLNKMVEHIEMHSYPANHVFDVQDHYLYLVKSGKVDVVGERVLETIEVGDFFGEVSMFFNDILYPTVQTSEASEIYRIPIEIVKNIPILNWKLFERHEKRTTLFEHERAGYVSNSPL